MDDYVLIVDDQLGIRILLEEIIRSEGYEAYSCESGAEALKYLERKTPSLLLTDFWLPLMNGAELIEQIEAKDIYIPTIVMSGLPEEAKERTAHLQSIHLILAKPFNVTQIKQHIHSILKK